jgi:hypothetical protein
MSIEKEFIPYEQALALKELGFNEDCFGWYNWTGKDLSLTNNSYVDINPTPAPLFQQAFRWFREKYGKESYVRKLHTYYYHINDTEAFVGDFSTYEEAELECLKKLIEIVKEK